MKLSPKRHPRKALLLRTRRLSFLALSCGAAALLAGTPPAAHSQSSTTGAISGTISDLNGALLPGASVTIRSNDTGVTRTVRANGSGEFRISELEPGTYTATVTAEGFRAEQTDKIVVTVGSVAALTPKLSVGAVTDKVEVTDEQPQLHTDDNSISTTVDQNAIDNLPINGRRWSSFALLTPGVVSNADGFGLLSFRGISYLLNNNTVDGADNNQAYFSEERGRTRVGYSTTQVAVQEFQVNTSNYSAEYGRSAGGVINTVTKSGTNNYHGELFFYDRDNSLGGAINPYTTLTAANAAGTYVTTPYKPKDWRKQWGFGLGGPILRDKLFFFYAYDQERRNFPGTARASDPADTFAAASSVLPTSQTCTATRFTAPSDSTGATVSYAVNAASTPSASGYPIGSSFEGNYAACSLAAAFGTSYQAGAAYYTQGLGIISSFLGTVPRVLDQVINFPKLDYQINDRNRLSLQYNRLRSSSPAGVQTQASNFYGTNSFGNDFVKEDFGIARLNTVLSSSMVNSFLVQYGRDFEYESSQAPSPNELPLANNVFARAAQTQIGYYFDNNGFDIGKSVILERRALPDERRLQLLDGVTFSHGGHTTKFGLDYNKVGDYINNLYDENGNYSYDFSYDFIADYLHATTGLGGSAYTPLYYGFGQGFGSGSSEITTREYAGYLTDDWRVTPRLTLTLGVRYEYEYVPANPTPNLGNQALVNAFATTASPISLAATAVPASLFRPDDRNNIGPRVGFAYNVYGDGNTILRGGYGLYYGRIINSNVLQSYLNSGGANSQVNFTSLYGGNCGPTFPAIIPSAQAIYNCFAGQNVAGLSPVTTPRAPTSTISHLDAHLQNPQVHEMDLAIEQNLGHGNVFALTYMGSLGRELDSSINQNETIQSTVDTTYTVVDNPVPTTRTGYTTLPHGGKPAPLKNGQQIGVRVFTTSGTASANPNPYYGQILDIASNVNSSYHALAVQFNHRYSNGFSLLSNFTWSHALDNNPYIGTGVPTFNVYDPTNLNLEHGNSSLDIRRRFVAAATYEPQTHFEGFKKYAFGGWRIAPIVQVQSGLPYTPSVSGSPTILNPTTGQNYTLAYKTYNGSGSSAARILQLGRNTFNRPKTAVVDLRLGKNFYLPDFAGQHLRLEIFAEAFNLMNHQNITGISTAAYTLSGTTLTNNTNFGTYTNADSNTTYSQRQLELAARLHF